VLRAAARTGPGRQIVHAAVMPDPASQSMSAADWPPALEGFEDLAFLFTSGQLNHGLASLGIDEGALLYRLARRAGPATLVEIGRFRGGSTLILATAMDPDARLHSYDLLEPDAGLALALAHFGLAERVVLHVGDSRRAPQPDGAALVFVDGDHSYAGARADFERWAPVVRPGGHLLFHDAVPRDPYGSFDEPIARLVSEIERDDASFRREQGAGSIAHFVRSA
jgi:predicted O-methyltransferase YrrM